MRLDGKVALITGAAHGVKGEMMGFGGASAWMFAEEGARVALTDVDVDAGERTVAQMRDAGHDVMFVRLDVTNEDEWRAAVEATVGAYGKLDVLVNNAGTGGRARVEDTTEEVWQGQLDVHGKGVFLGTEARYPAYAGGGRAARSSTYRPSTGWWAASALLRTTRARARRASSPSRRRCSSPRTGLG